MANYVKLFDSIVGSTIWQEDDHTRLVWITILVRSNQHGEVYDSIPGLAHLARVPLESCEKAITKFLNPDKFSRTAEFEGRRLKALEGGGWEIINYTKYREKANKEDQLRLAAERQQRFRERHKKPAKVTLRNACVTESNDIGEGKGKGEGEGVQQLQQPQQRKIAEVSDTVTPRNAPSTISASVPNPTPTPYHDNVTKPVHAVPASDSTAPITPALPGFKKLDQQAKPKAEKADKPPKQAAGCLFPPLDPATKTIDNNPTATKVSAWAVWIDVRRDLGLPDPIPDPKDTSASKVIAQVVKDRPTLEWLYLNFLQDNDDSFISNIPRENRPLRLLSSRAPGYLKHILAQNPVIPYRYRSAPPTGAAEAVAALCDHQAGIQTFSAFPTDSDPDEDPEAYLRRLESEQ